MNSPRCSLGFRVAVAHPAHGDRAPTSAFCSRRSPALDLVDCARPPGAIPPPGRSGAQRSHENIFACGLPRLLCKSSRKIAPPPPIVGNWRRVKRFEKPPARTHVPSLVRARASTPRSVRWRETRPAPAARPYRRGTWCPGRIAAVIEDGLAARRCVVSPGDANASSMITQLAARRHVDALPDRLCRKQHGGCVARTGWHTRARVSLHYIDTQLAFDALAHRPTSVLLNNLTRAPGAHLSSCFARPRLRVRDWATHLRQSRGFSEKQTRRHRMLSVSLTPSRPFTSSRTLRR